VHPDSLADAVLVGLGIVTLVAVPLLLAREDRVTLFVANRYLAATRRAPRWLPHISDQAPTRTHFIIVVRLISRVARVAAFTLSVVGAVLVLVGADTLE
jgi:hypothetical protein